MELTGEIRPLSLLQGCKGLGWLWAALGWVGLALGGHWATLGWVGLALGGHWAALG